MIKLNQLKQQVKISGTVPNSISGTIEAFLAKDNDFKQDAYLFQVKLDGGVVASDNQIKIASIDVNHPLNDCGDKSTKNNSLLIEDNGIGIKPEEIPFIFDRFYRADSSRSSVIKGKGLGLSIVKKLADLSQIDIKVESEPNLGTLFHLQFPV